MRLPVLLLALAGTAPAASAGPAPAGDMPVVRPGPPQGDAKECPPTSRHHATRGKQRLNAQPLDELPVGDMYAAVYRRIGRCEAPVIVRYGIGGEQR